MRTARIMPPAIVPIRAAMRQTARKDAFETFLSGEVVLVALLGAALALFLSKASLRTPYDLPQLRLVLSTLYVVGGGLRRAAHGDRGSASRGAASTSCSAAGSRPISLSWLAFALGPAVVERPESAPSRGPCLGGVLAGWTVHRLRSVRARADRAPTAPPSSSWPLPSPSGCCDLVRRARRPGLPTLDAPGRCTCSRCAAPRWPLLALAQPRRGDRLRRPLPAARRGSRPLARARRDADALRLARLPLRAAGRDAGT